MFGQEKIIENLLGQLSEERTRNAELVTTITRMQREGFRVVAAGEPASAVTLDPAILDAIADVPEEARPEVMRWALQQRGDPEGIARDIREGR